MEEDKIVLDRRSFEALAVDSRVKILKSLKGRRKTLSELAKEQGMSVSGVKEHLETLVKVGLIEKIDDGHKWKYYELTRKGGDIIGPKELRVWILLSLSSVALILSIFAMLPTAQMASGLPLDDGTSYAMDAERDAPPMMMARATDNCTDNDDENCDTESTLLTASPEETSQKTTMAEPPAPWQNDVPLAVAGISAVTLAVCGAILIRNRLPAKTRV